MASPRKKLCVLPFTGDPQCGAMNPVQHDPAGSLTCFVCDVSGSMPKKASNALEQLMGYLDARLEGTNWSVSFAATVGKIVKDNHKIAFCDAMNGNERNRTALYDAMAAVARHPFPRGKVVRVYVFTDGKDNESKGTYKQSMEAFRAANITVHIIFVTLGDDHGALAREIDRADPTNSVRVVAVLAHTAAEGFAQACIHDIPVDIGKQIQEGRPPIYLVDGKAKSCAGNLYSPNDVPEHTAFVGILDQIETLSDEKTNISGRPDEIHTLHMIIALLAMPVEVIVKMHAQGTEIYSLQKGKKEQQGRKGHNAQKKKAEQLLRYYVAHNWLNGNVFYHVFKDTEVGANCTSNEFNSWLSFLARNTRFMTTVTKENKQTANETNASHVFCVASDRTGLGEAVDKNETLRGIKDKFPAGDSV